MKIRNIPRNLAVYSRRLVYRNAINLPYISGDFFSSLSDYSFSERDIFEVEKKRELVSKADVIFIPGHLYEDICIAFTSALNPKIIVLGNSDRDFFTPLNGVPSSVKRIFLQNSTISNEKYQTIPIGLENQRLGANGLKHLFGEKFIRSKKNNSVLFGPFSPTHADRRFINTLENSVNGEWVVLRERISARKYASLASNFLYVACPRGNGLDTHRFWETLYRGSYPVVISSDWSRKMKNLGYPVVEIDDWSAENIHSVLKVERPPINPEKIEALWASFWKSKILSELSSA